MRWSRLLPRATLPNESLKLSYERSRGILWLINSSRCLVKSCKSPFLGKTNQVENLRLRLSDARKTSTSHND